MKRYLIAALAAALFVPAAQAEPWRIDGGAAVQTDAASGYQLNYQCLGGATAVVLVGPDAWDEVLSGSDADVTLTVDGYAVEDTVFRFIDMNGKLGAAMVKQGPDDEAFATLEGQLLIAGDSIEGRLGEATSRFEVDSVMDAMSEVIGTCE